MDAPSNNLRAIRPADIDPRFNWERHLPALGTMAVDFEERVNYRRLHEYRVGRTRRALEASWARYLSLMSTTFAIRPLPKSASGSVTSFRAGRCWCAAR